MYNFSRYQAKELALAYMSGKNTICRRKSFCSS